MAEKESNPVLKVVHDIQIRKYNYHNIMFNAQAYEDLVNESAATGLSIPVLVALKSKPCQECGCDNVKISIKKDGRANKQNTSEDIVAKNAKRQ